MFEDLRRRCAPSVFLDSRRMPVAQKASHDDHALFVREVVWPALVDPPSCSALQSRYGRLRMCTRSGAGVEIVRRRRSQAHRRFKQP
eukprot:CAMPEP_0176038578 /NCGR_PEP_ID=MMETSP0120_2-20121206/19119_1 /TAXON_ID=160619 /ORGANISM="Kryptoperidinium foliaceum, Strain CCMP 1326" /LENGTH=86 /DNA_ID=CAMNT_0017371971 /DNA_START=95 /DNA_END=351 /DNA_ORIENTATION=+